MKVLKSNLCPQQINNKAKSKEGNTKHSKDISEIPKHCCHFSSLALKCQIPLSLLQFAVYHHLSPSAPPNSFHFRLIVLSLPIATSWSMAMVCLNKRNAFFHPLSSTITQPLSPRCRSGNLRHPPFFGVFRLKSFSNVRNRNFTTVIPAAHPPPPSTQYSCASATMLCSPPTLAFGSISSSQSPFQA